MNAIILDTETHDLKGLPIEIAYMPYSFIDGKPKASTSEIYDEYFSIPDDIKISWGAMAMHHILEQDIKDKPSYLQFKLPDAVEYIIGHNVDYDIEAIRKCGVDVGSIKGICTLALARYTWKNEQSHSLSALVYMLLDGMPKAREVVRDAHNAAADIRMTASILNSIVAKNSIKTIKDLYQLSEIARTPVEMPFGKYKGLPIHKLESNYVEWLLKQTELDPYLKKALKRRGGG